MGGVRNITVPQKSVYLSKKETQEFHPVFSFEDFHLNSICIHKVFNNHFKNKDVYNRVIATLFGRGLKLLEGENVNELIMSRSKSRVMHFHKIRNEKKDVVEKVLKEYHFKDDKIIEMMQGDSLYQFEIPFENGAARVVFQIVSNIFSLLFLDTNHHIYFDRKQVERAGSLYYDECPMEDAGKCDRMNYLNTCFAFEFLDEKKLFATYENSYNPQNDE